MKKMTLPDRKKLSHKLEQLDSLLFSKNFKQALAELRELENQKVFVESNLEAGHFYTIFSAVLNNLGNHNEALEKGLKAFNILKHTNEIQKIVRIQIILGDIYLRLGDLKNAQAEYRDSFAFYRSQEPCKKLLDIYNKLAHVCFIQGEFDKAIEYLKDGIEYAKALDDGHVLFQLGTNLGTVYVFLGKFELAEELHLLFRHPAMQQDEVLRINWFLNNAGVFTKRRKFIDAKEYLDKSYDLIVKHSLMREKAIYHEYAGELAFVIGDYLSAERHYQEALKIGEEIAPEGDIISQTCRLLAELRFAQGNYDEALEFCQRSLGVCQKIKERFEEGIVYRILGQIYTSKGEFGLAKENFEKGISILKVIGAKYELGKAHLEAGKSDCYSYFERLKLLGQAEDVLKDTDSKYLLGKTYSALAELLYENEQYEKGISFAKEAEKVFEELKEKEDLSLTIRIKKKIESKAGHESIADKNSNLVFSNIVTQNRELLDIIKRMEQVLNTDLTMLLEGETGTGKDLLAKTIHYNSNRKDKRYIALNCANLPETLFESELFGYKKGAFTGANLDKKGLLEEVDGGTLLLNEIGEIPLSVQAKLLNVIEEKEFTRLGDTKSIKVNVRFIAATNQDLKKAVEQRRFREDLYYRLSVIKVELPPLRERKEDVFLLCHHFLEKHCNGNCDKIEGLSQKIAENLFFYDWPGNVRELENEILKFSALMGTKQGSDLDRFVQQIRMEKLGPIQNGSIAERKVEMEVEEIRKALKVCNNIKANAAKILDMPESTLRRKIKVYNISQVSEEKP
ncbi:MAG: sigma 54-interacting transcriptional regulator [candidate division Zixibacteria bacterium]|nr:sigma 54-interacting transcriptional regulator [candidate division Zixibacteria bacterium]